MVMILLTDDFVTQSKKNKMLLLEEELRGTKENSLNEEPPCSAFQHIWDFESYSESEPEPYFKVRFVCTINDESDNDSDLDDNFMFDSVSEVEFENNLVSDSDSVSDSTSENIITKNSCNKNKSCNEVKTYNETKSCENRNLNKDSNSVIVPVTKISTSKLVAMVQW